MIGAKALKENECNTIEDYYKKIVELVESQQPKEAKALIVNLADQQKTHLLSLVWESPNISGEVAQYIAEQL